jgi:hypothetical protein
MIHRRVVIGSIVVSGDRDSSPMKTRISRPEFNLVMSDHHPIPNQMSPALRWLFAVVFLIVFAGGASDSFRGGATYTALIYCALFVVSFFIAVFWVQVCAFLRATSRFLFFTLSGAAFVVLGFGVGMYFGRRSEPIPAAIGSIVWNFEQTAHGNGYFLNMQKLNNDEIRVTGFGAHGKNISDAPISDVRGYMRSDVTNIQIPILLLAQDPDETKIKACFAQAFIPTAPQDTFGVPAFADFDVVTFEKPFVEIGKDGITLTKFLNDFVPFTIVLEYGGTKYHRQFSKAEVENQVEIYKRTFTPQTTPRVVRKENAKPPPMAPLQTLIPPDLPKTPPGLSSPIPLTGLPKLPSQLN